MKIDASQLNESKPLVLIIDDSIDVHRLLNTRLKNEDLEIVNAHGGQEGLAMAHERRPAIILLDLDMPDLDGFEVLRAIKDDIATLHIPVIVLSGLQSPQDKVTAFDLGAMDYITKPFDLAELRVRVRSAVRLHYLLQMLSQRAQIDGLTGLWNRGYFDTRWGEAVANARRHKRPLSLAVFDVDHFKSVNDTHGHPAGDAVLQGLARVVQKAIRETDIPCRYGGEEFALIMPDTTPADGMVVCERIRTTLQDVVWPSHPDRSVTLSIGLVGSARSSRLEASEWIEEADRNLYDAKSQGRNRTVMTDVTSNQPKLRRAG